MHVEVTGLILRCVDIGESDRLISIYTREQGTVTAMVKGGKSHKNQNMAAIQQYCYSSFILYKRGDKLWVKESSLIESFFGIRGDLVALSLAGYIVEVLTEVSTSEGDPDLMRLALNSLYALSEKKYGYKKVKAAFEIRALAIIGFMPEVLACHSCGKREGDFYFDIMGGAIQCAECKREAELTASGVYDDGERRIVAMLSEGAKIALGYLIHCPPERIFAFNIGDEDMELLSRATEEYLVNQLEKSFKSLEFYKEVTA
ncbi:MAG: DNA repair protein RecO [Clostridia bacterium]|nr:DNA repair protein RecO [Clostridia bacterium]